jgi:hypothetical protein
MGCEGCREDETRKIEKKVLYSEDLALSQSHPALPPLHLRLQTPIRFWWQHAAVLTVVGRRLCPRLSTIRVARPFPGKRETSLTQKDSLSLLSPTSHISIPTLQERPETKMCSNLWRHMTLELSVSPRRHPEAPSSHLGGGRRSRTVSISSASYEHVCTT